MKERIDKILVERGMVESRARAQALILAGQVLVGEQRIDKPGQMIDASADIRIRETLRYASRGGLKLEAALREFSIDPTAKSCIDVGASTGGFTDCLLQHGAARVCAIDVGHNQIIWRLRQDPRVEVMEGINARNLEPDLFPLRFDIAVVDVSFISLGKILPSVARILVKGGDCVALIKPQFEVGRGEVGKKGIVTDPKKHRRVIREVKEAAHEAGLKALWVIESPVEGAEGNREFLMHFRLAPEGASESKERIEGQIEAITSV